MTLVSFEYGLVPFIGEVSIFPFLTFTKDSGDKESISKSLFFINIPSNGFANNLNLEYNSNELLAFERSNFLSVKLI